MYRLKFSIYFVLGFILANVIIFFVGSWIAFDFNPLNWWLIRDVWGRIMCISIEISTIGIVGSIVDDKNL